MENGYVKLHRKLLENPIADRPAWAWLWVVLLLKANWEEKEIIWNGEILKLQPGQFVTGRKALSKDTGVRPSTIEDILKYLETRHQIRQQKFNKFRIITIENWKIYQIENEKPDTKSDNQPTTKRQQSDTDKNVKNIKNDKNTLVAPRATDEINPIIDLFKEVNPSWQRLFAQTPQRQAIERLIKKIGKEKVVGAIKTIAKTNSMQFAPVITTPYELEKKLGLLIAFVKKEGDKINKNKIETI